MPPKDTRVFASTSDLSPAPRKARFAAGIGITTLVTVLVVMLLTTFSILSLVSARSDLHLSEMAATAAANHYAADSEATQWYAQLVKDIEQKTPEASQESTLAYLGEITLLADGAFEIRKVFDEGDLKELVVTVAVAPDGTPTIRQWQSVPRGTE
ncbi:MAG: hypothetical protein LBB42_01130 [Coriobacteriales bacterium]|jgi:hypothetical protein|nr:hypothetical protein [Coriobacteriales bacterium]